jgi:hypothetical protein
MWTETYLTTKRSNDVIALEAVTRTHTPTPAFTAMAMSTAFWDEDPAPATLMELMDEVEDALGSALFTFGLQADLEEALDTALLRDHLAQTAVVDRKLSAVAA